MKKLIVIGLTSTALTQGAAAQSPRLVDVYGPASVPPGCRSYGCPAPPFLWVPPFLALLPLLPPPPVAALPPPVDAPPAGPVPLGWVYGPYTMCTDPKCTGMYVSVGADGLNVRTAPDGPVVASLANGVPLIPMGQDGKWVLVAPACPLAPTYTWSVTAGGVPLSVCM